MAKHTARDALEFDGQMIASGALLVSFQDDPPSDREVVGMEGSPLDAQLLLLNARYPSRLPSFIREMAAQDKERLVNAAAASSMAYRITRDIMDILSGSEPSAIDRALVKLSALHLLLDIGTPPEKPLDEDRHCLSEIVRSWLYPAEKPEGQFTAPGAAGMVACTINLLLAYGASVRAPMSDPAGMATSTDQLLADDEVLGPLVIWEKGEFLTRLMNLSSHQVSFSPPRPRL